MSATRAYEVAAGNALTELLAGLVSESDIVTQWLPFRGERGSKYSPRIDLAVGPFAYRTEQYGQRYNALTNLASRFVLGLLGDYRSNAAGYGFRSEIPNSIDEIDEANSNARCFLCIEIERSGSRKHRVGDIVNACSLGRVGIVIAWDQDVLKSFLGITEYLNYLRTVGKITYSTKNLVVVTRPQFDNQVLSGLS